MVALGIEGDAAPNPLQPAPLVDGVHLRWACAHELGFPWYGFHLFRREHQEGKPQCDTPDADLRGRDELRFPLPDLSRRVLVRIGFEKEGEAERRCEDVSERDAAVGRNPLELGDLVIEVFDRGGGPVPDARIVRWLTSVGELGGVDVVARAVVTLPEPADWVSARLTSMSMPGTVEAFDKAGVAVARQTMSARRGEPETIVLTGEAIATIAISAPQQELLLHGVCFGSGDPGAAGGAIPVRAERDGVVVASASAEAPGGGDAVVELTADAIDAVVAGGGPARLLEVCWVPVAQGAGKGWERLKGFSYPLSMPVHHPDYPALSASVDLGASEALALGRVRYGAPGAWAGGPFAELHDLLLELVDGGPAAGEMASRERSVAGTATHTTPRGPPKMTRQRPLDLVLLGSLNAAVAEMTGLLFADETVSSGTRYDYLIVADHPGAARRDPKNALRLVAGGDWSKLDGWICFDVHAGPSPDLAAPAGPRAYALPGSTKAGPGGSLVEETMSAGLRWTTAAPGGTMLARDAILHHVWRDELGDGPAPKPPGSYDPVTKDGPVLAGTPSTPPSTGPPSDWPPFPLHYADGPLEDGWYAYRLSGIDVFGRHSDLSGPAAWHQWAPEPSPVPWYYLQPPSDVAVHSWAVRLLDKTPPPVPTGVEAWALDPEDPYVQRDAVYQAWHAALGAGEQTTLVGLRVRWIWTEAHMRQAPRTSEFRIYWNSGTYLPTGHPSPPAWEKRLWVVDYDDHFTAGTDDNGRPQRHYEVILPLAGDPTRTGADLPVTATNPIAWAHVGVSAADDRAHVADDPARTGQWGGRAGAEGDVGPPAKVVRVRRVAPPAPVPPPDSERVWATPADYHSHSYYTFRWQPQPNLKAHVCRAVDDSIFQVDWARRAFQPTPVVSPGNASTFPSEPRWDSAKRQQVAAEINQLNTFPQTDSGREQAMAHYRSLSNDALRVLAGLPWTEAAFSQLTIEPLDPAEPENANRVGPDNSPTFTVDPALRAYVDELDGRSTSRWFYRAGFVDEVHNRGPLGLSSPPVYLPNVMPPRSPAIARVTLDDGEATVAWASNREADLASYLVYRGEGDDGGRDVRAMTLVHTEAVAAGDPAARPAQVTFTDTGLVGGRTYAYRIVAVDDDGNASQPSDQFVVKAVDRQPPPPPVITGAAWVVVQDLSQMTSAWPTGGTIPAGWRAAVRLRWKSEVPVAAFMLTRKEREELRFRPLELGARVRGLPTGELELLDDEADPTRVYAYRLSSVSEAGVPSEGAAERQVPRP
jgi:hypothetical protein